MDGVYLYPQVMTLTNSGAGIYSGIRKSAIIIDFLVQNFYLYCTSGSGIQALGQI
ncbi:hypothetical protein L873DRAFT_1816785 [Choiromyces venosus 120613-1]|uniref:Uncharacterized protein n=1 Tax=Choiromyces venosus 120613-1 TaxID=1336337 RepID=A0A3N4J8V7_9PEZI|nr:hypothetical protein L873DRAFT_1816785 [Choiromyces venosus 120613-1]